MTSPDRPSLEYAGLRINAQTPRASSSPHPLVAFAVQGSIDASSRTISLPLTHNISPSAPDKRAELIKLLRFPLDSTSHLTLMVWPLLVPVPVTLYVLPGARVRATSMATLQHPPLQPFPPQAER
jgi:hypothetical protein